MKIVESAIRYPVTTAVGAILLVMFGGLAFFQIPVQLTPTVEEPEITITTSWPGASPREVEREIVAEQEEQLKGLEGLLEMASTSSDSSGQISLRFATGTDLDVALLKVSTRLDQVPRYPPDAEKPLIQSVGAQAMPMAWFLLMPSEDEDAFTGDVATLGSFFEDTIKPHFERVSGVGQVGFFAGRKREMHVVIDPAKLAARQISITQFLMALDQENRNISGGDFNEGKRRYIVRTVGEYTSTEEIEAVVVAVRQGTPIYVRDVGRAQLGYAKPFAEAFYLGQPMIAFNTVRETGANVLHVMAELKRNLELVNRELLQPRGLQVIQVWDETEYIHSAIDLVRQSLLLGGTLAIIILLLFLRSRSSTLVVAIAIPISMVGTFLMMKWFGRTLNVVSLAGMAFAVGMVVDNSIVVLENIYRHRQMGKPRIAAAREGAGEVWGAVLASTLTTIAVFLPILFVQEEAGQLFRDIALAISCAVGLSLAVAVTVIPSLSAKILGTAGPVSSNHGFKNLWGLTSWAGSINDWVTDRVYWITGSTTRRLTVVIGFTLVAILLSFLLAPQAEYLPTGNQNLLFGIILPPPGQSVQENSSLRSIYTEALAHLWETAPEDAVDLPGGGIRHMFYVAMADQVFLGVTARKADRVRELIPVFQKVNAEMPGSIAFITQFSMFQQGFSGGRSIDIELSGPDLEHLIALGSEVFEKVREVLPGAQVRPVPSLDLGNPEVHVRTDRRRAAEMGISNRDLGTMVNVLIDGAKASEYRYEGHEIDLRVVADTGHLQRTHLIDQLPLSTPSGELITLGSVAAIEIVSGPAQIAHVERERAITIKVSPSEEIPLQLAMETIENDVLGPMRGQKRLGGLYRARLSGTADKLTLTRRSLQRNFILAIVITYLLMAALFESFLYPFVILFSVPLAALGGFLGLAVVNLFTYQALDVLTMLGFIILVGTVVNNAILIVHQSLNHMREESMPPRQAIREAVHNRIRPIFMSVSTSICGMLPLVLFPGAGSELYRGLGSVVVGGLIVSTVFTLILVPALFSLVLDARENLKGRLYRRRDHEPGLEPTFDR